MIEIISLHNADQWDRIVKSFSQFDVYYLCGYVKAFHLHGDGDPLLFCYESRELRGICVMMKRDVAKDKHFDSRIPESTFYDLITPYGYGGFLFEGEINDENLSVFNRAFSDLILNEGFISVFIRFHPLLINAVHHVEVVDVINLGKTIEINLSSEAIVWQNISSKNRNVIRGAEKKGVVIKNSKGIDLFEKFQSIYNRTMELDNADPYYYFGMDFYKSIHKDLFENYEIFYAEYEGQIIAMSIILFVNDKIHYHLSGSIFEFRHLAPTNLLLYKVALWGVDKGFKTFHLGGGLGSGEDGLFKFKKAFNRHSGLQFSIGRKICDHKRYRELVDLRKSTDPEFNEGSSYFPLYRS